LDPPECASNDDNIATLKRKEGMQDKLVKLYANSNSAAIDVLDCSTDHNSSSEVAASTWDSAKLFKIKDAQGCLISLPSRTGDDVSSIASSVHSGRIPLPKRNFSVGPRGRRRISSRGSSSGGKSVFSLGWNNKNNNSSRTLLEANGLSADGSVDCSVADDVTSKGARVEMSKKKNTPYTSWRKRLASSLTSSARPNGHIIRIDEEDDLEVDDDDDRSLEDAIFDAIDEKCQAVENEACKIMESVNKSTVTMGMDAPFCPVDEMFPPFKKLHKNVGYQLVFLKAVVGPPRDKSRKTRQRTKSTKKNYAPSLTSYNTPSVTS